MSRQMQLVRAVALAADGFYGDAKKLGEVAAGCFPSSRRSQITGLENVAAGAIKISDVLDYVKKQIGKEASNQPDKHIWRKDDFGIQLLEYLEKSLREQLDRLAITPPLTDAAERQRTHLMLIREFVRQVAAHYEFSKITG